MNTDVILTCAVTGDGDTVGKSDKVPVTPVQIADAALEAARAGATIAHIHVRDPKTGKGSRDPALYRAVVERIRASGVDIIVNLTAGMGGKFLLSEEDPTRSGPGTDMVGAIERMVHIEELRPEICSLDCGSFNSGADNEMYVSTLGYLRIMARRMRDCGVKPELECFDTGHVRLASQLVAEGLVEAPPFYQLALGVNWGAPAETQTMLAMRDMLPPGALWAGFGIARMQMPMVAQAMLLGGHVRVGLEDNIYLERGVLASNGQLVERACRIIRDLGGRPLTPAEGRAKLGLRRR